MIIKAQRAIAKFQLARIKAYASYKSIKLKGTDMSEMNFCAKPWRDSKTSRAF